VTRPVGDLSRRQLLAGAAGAAGVAGVAAVGGLGAASASAAVTAALPEPAASGIDHIVVVMMENRSFDHYLGWVDGADGKQAGLTFLDREGVAHETHHLTDFQGCSNPDPDHSFEGGRVQLNDGACDGWLRSGENDAFSIGYYTDAVPDGFAPGPAGTTSRTTSTTTPQS
jgi:phospholipase C